METYPSRYDLNPGTAERVMQQGRWWVLWLAPRNEVFVAISERPDVGVWDGYTLELEEDGSYDVSETSLGVSILHTNFDSKACDITSDRNQVDCFFKQLRQERKIPQLV